jgi:two-component system, OmpR family, alkaline phosphatase synthesis response regulator PhoP
MPKTILVVEDEPGIRLSLSDELESAGYRVVTAENGEKALAAAAREKPDLIILDIMMPVLDGTEVCKRLRARGDRTPIIMLTVRDTEVDKVLGLELGADDYMTKPFSLRELVARIKAVFRRAEETRSGPDVFSFAGIELDFKKFEATKRGRSLDLTPLEFHMLKLFVERRGEVLTRDDFLDGVWGEDNVSVSFRTVDSHIANIRRKIEDDPSRPRHILSVRGVGYKFVGTP